MGTAAPGIFATPTFAFVVLLVFANANADKQCNIQCHGSAGQIFKYTPGTTYRYKLDGLTVTEVHGAHSETEGDDNVSRLTLTANADVTVQANCVHVLKLSDVHITTSDGKTYQDAAELESKPIRFGMNNGQLTDELCVAAGESTTALNIKRAIISLLQAPNPQESGTTSHSENDIFGRCPTNTHYESTGTGLKIKKIRNLNHCYGREHLNVPYLTLPYSTHSEVQSIPLMTANQDVDQRVAGGVVKSVVSTETYEYSPVEGTSGVKMTVLTKLNLVTHTKGGAAAGRGNVVKSLLFEPPHTHEDNSKEAGDAIATALHEACGDAKHDKHSIHEDEAGVFAKLVGAITKASKQQILAVFSTIKSGSGYHNKDHARHLLFEGIRSAKSASSIEVMAELLKKEEVTGNVAEAWKLALGDVKHVSLAGLNTVLPLLDGEPTANTYLGIGAMAGRYCREHPCQGSAPLGTLEQKLASPLLTGSCTPGTLDAEDHLLASLKGLSNIGFLTEEVGAKLVECASNKNARTRVRAAALDTIKSDPKKTDFKKAATTILKDLTEDSELRIKAYLILADCPCPKTAETIKEVLEHEKILQVGAYIVSHLRNLRSTTNPNKAQAKHHFGHIITSHVFPFDIRKYSQNHEFSYSLDDINMGATAETDIIYSQKSFVPRSVSLNLTSQLFGHSFNWLELDARVENLDHALESLFGPKGKFNTHSGNEILDEMVQKTSTVEDRIKQKYGNTWRATRSVSRAQLEAMYQKSHKTQKDAHDNIVDLDLSLKMFGSEKGWFNYHSTEDKLDWDVLLDKAWGAVDHTINEAKHLNIDRSRHLTFLDGELAYPTALGLPIKLKVLGSEATRLGLEGKVDLPAIFRDPDNTEVAVKVLASAAIELSGTLSMDGTLVENGVRLSLTVHTATGVEVAAHLLNGNGIDVKVKLPLEKQQIITAKSQLTNVVKERGHPETHKPIEFNSKSEEMRMCFDQLSDAFGLTLCGALEVPAVPTILTPVRLSAWLEKDSELTQYHFKIFLDADDAHHGVNFEVLFDTPETKTDRKLNLAVHLALKPKPLIKISAHVPWYSLYFQGDLNDTPKEKTLAAKLKLAEDEYSLKAGVRVSVSDSTTVKYEPFLDFKGPQGSQHSKLISRKGAPKQAAYSLTGAVNVKTEPDKVTYSLDDLTLHLPQISYTANGHFIRRPFDFLEADLKITYDKENVLVKAKIDFTDQLDGHVYLSVAMSELPDLGISIQWDMDAENEFDTVDSILTIVHGPDPNSQDSRITIKNYFQFKDDSNHEEFITKNAVTYPIFNIEGKLNVELLPTSSGYDIAGRFSEYEAGSFLNLKWAMKTPLDYEFSFGASASNIAIPKTYSIGVTTTHHLVEEDTSKFTNQLEFVPGGKYSLNADVIHKFDDDDTHLNIDAELHLPVEPKLSKFVAGIKSNNDGTSGLFKLSGGPKKYVDFTYSVKDHPHPSGKYNLILPGFIKSNGEFSLTPSNFKSLSKVELPKYKRTMEAKADINIADPRYTGYFLVNWDTQKPDKTLKIETNSLFDEHEFDTKNTILFEGQKTQVNLKGKSTGTVEDGILSGEAELILPNTRHVIARFSHAVETEPGDHEGEVLVELLDYEKKGDNPTKLVLKLVGKHVDWERCQFDGQAAITYMDKQGKDMSAHATLKKMPANQAREKWTINGQFQVLGSLIHTPLDLKFESEMNSLWLEGNLNPDNTFPPLNYHVTASAGPSRTLEAVGKLNGQVITSEVTVNLPEAESPSLHTIKWTTNSNIAVPVETAQHIKVKSNNVLAWNNDKFFKTNIELTEDETDTKVRLEWESDSFSKRTFIAAVHGVGCENNPGNICSTDIFFSNDFDGKHGDITFKLDGHYNWDWAHVHLHGTSFDAKKFDILIKTKEVKGSQGFVSDLVMTIDQKKVTGGVRFEGVDNHPLIDIYLEQPEGKSRFMWKMDKMTDFHFSSEVKLKWVGHGGGSLNADNEFDLSSWDNLLIRGNMDSAALGIDNIQLMIAGGAHAAKIKQKPGSRALTFYIKKANKNLYSGDLSFNVKQDTDHGSFEGSGTMKIAEESYPLSVKSTFDGDAKYYLFKLTASAGPFNLNMDGKKTKDEFKFERTICTNGKAKCSTGYFHVYRKLDANNSEHVIDMIADFSLWSQKLHDFKMNAAVKKTENTYDESLNLQWSETGKIKYSHYQHSNKIGYLMEVPSRTVAGEVAITTPHDTKDHSSGRIEANLWLNKKKSPNKKTSALLTWDAKESPTLNSVSGEIMLTHPSLARPLKASGKLTMKEDSKDKVVIDGHADVDIFEEQSHAIKGVLKANGHMDKSSKKYIYNSLLTVKSSGLKIDMKYDHKYSSSIADNTFSSVEKFTYLDSTGQLRESISSIVITPHKLHILVKIPEMTVLEVNAKIEKKLKGKNEEISAITAHYNILGAKYKESLTVNPSPLYKYQFLFSKAGGEKVLDATFSFKKGGDFKINFDKKKLLDAHIEVTPENHIKPKYSYDSENALSLYNTYISEVAHLTELFEDALDKVTEKVSTETAHTFGNIARALPDFGPIVEGYTKEVEAIKAEVMSDTYLMDIFGDLRESLSAIMEHIVLVAEELSHFWASVDAMLLEVVEKVNLIIKDILPEVKASLANISNVLRDLYIEWTQFTMQLTDLCLKELVRIEEELKIIVDSYAEYFKDFGKALVNMYNVIDEEVANILHNMYEFFSELPMLDFINEKFMELFEILSGFQLTDLNSPEDMVEAVNEILGMLRSISPTREVTDFVEITGEYIKKIIKSEDFDEDEAAEKIYRALVAAYESLEKLLDDSSESGDSDTSLWESIESFFESPSMPLLHAPKGSWRFSFAEWLLSSDLPELDEIISTYLPFNILKPFSIFPPYTAMGAVLGNGDVITFDGVLVSLGHGGECTYMLAKDIYERNFSLAATFGPNGKLKSVALADHHDIVELRHDKNALVNGKEREYLIIEGGLKAWRTPSSYGMYSNAGVLVKCDSEFRWCLFHINGYYHNRLRGILGNPNYEPYDDSTTSQATIAASKTELVNSWKLTEGCSAPHSEAESKEREAICTKFFTGEDSNFASCFFSESPALWRTTCDHSVHLAKGEEQKRVAACGVAAAYAHACRAHGNPLSPLPDECIVCKVGDKRLKHEETQEVKIPGKSADVLFVVELNSKVEGIYKNFLVPLMTTLQANFKEHGVNDVHFGLAGYRGIAEEYTAYFTTNGKIKFTGKSEAVKFSPLGPMPNRTIVDKFNILRQMISEELGNTDRLRTFNDILLNYNFRPEAFKTVITLNSRPCETGDDFISLGALRTMLGFGVYRAMGIDINYIYPFKVSIEDAKSKTVVGFNQDHVYTLEDSQTKPIKGLTGKIDDLEYDSDVCVFFNKIVNGNVFAGGNFEAAQGEQKTHFVSVASQMIVDSATRDEVKMKCTCASSLDLLRPKPACFVEDVNERKAKKGALRAKGGAKA